MLLFVESVDLIGCDGGFTHKLVKEYNATEREITGNSYVRGENEKVKDALRRRREGENGVCS